MRVAASAKTGSFEVNGVNFQYVDYTPLIQAQQKAKDDLDLRICKLADHAFGDDHECGKLFTFVTAPKVPHPSTPSTDTLFCVRRQYNPARGSDPHDRSTWRYNVYTLACAAHSSPEQLEQAKQEIMADAAKEGGWTLK